MTNDIFFKALRAAAAFVKLGLEQARQILLGHTKTLAHEGTNLSETCQTIRVLLLVDNQVHRHHGSDNFGRGEGQLLDSVKNSVKKIKKVGD